MSYFFQPHAKDPLEDFRKSNRSSSSSSSNSSSSNSSSHDCNFIQSLPLFEQVRQIASNRIINQKLAERKCVSTFVKWEDTARNKNSCFGPNISDISLDVANLSFPIIGTRNFQDETFDLPIERFVVHVGNEVEMTDKTEELKQISFKEYLTNIEKYIPNIHVKNNSVYAERDSKILTSSQATILPLRDGYVEFNVRLHNYQVRRSMTSSVLCLVVSPHGTSAQFISESQQKIYFNQNGTNVSYRAERLMDKRIKAGESTEGPMNQKEKEANVLFIFQIPLKAQEKYEDVEWDVEEEKGDDCFCVSEDDLCCVPTCGMVTDDDDDVESIYFGNRIHKKKKGRGIDHAQLSLGKTNHGEFNNDTCKEMRHLIERDERFPIRCTMQYYYVTDTNEIDDDMLDIIAKQVWKLYDETHPNERGSLVTDGQTCRQTEATIAPVTATKREFFAF
jgi:hypothetical protein